MRTCFRNWYGWQYNYKDLNITCLMLNTLTFLISVHVRLFILTWISKLFALIRELNVYFWGKNFWADRLFWISSTFWMSTYVNFIHFEDLKRYVKTINPWCTIIWNVAKLYDNLLVHISPSCTIIQGCTLIRNVRVLADLRKLTKKIIGLD